MFSLLPYFARSDLKYMEQDGTNIDGDFSVAYLTDLYDVTGSV